MNTDRLFLFSGRMFAGKDFVAQAARLRRMGFADPIYQLCEHFNGTSDKSVPGVRQFLQQLGQWGWGSVSDFYPFTVERALMTREIRRHGQEMTRDFQWVDWSEYGKRADFWVNIALIRLGLRRAQIQNMPVPQMQPKDIAITNARFEHEHEPCIQAGFSHFHVQCSQETRLKRMASSGYVYKPDIDNDASEQMAQGYDRHMADRRVVWNDSAPMPAGRHFMTVNEFLSQTVERPTNMRYRSQDLVLGCN
jgi:hypothetical protein